MSNTYARRVLLYVTDNFRQRKILPLSATRSNRSFSPLKRFNLVAERTFANFNGRKSSEGGGKRRFLAGENSGRRRISPGDVKRREERNWMAVAAR